MNDSVGVEDSGTSPTFFYMQPRVLIVHAHGLVLQFRVWDVLSIAHCFSRLSWPLPPGSWLEFFMLILVFCGFVK
jgi:hypothetical protein